MRAASALVAMLLACGGAASAPSSGLVVATSPSDIAALVAEDPENAVDTLRAAGALGLGDPVDVIFAAVDPDTPAAAAERLAALSVTAAPRLADQIAAASLIAADITAQLARIEALATAIFPPLYDAELTDEARAEEVEETLIALISLIDPELYLPVAQRVAELTPDDDDGETLLAAIAASVETGSIRRWRRFGFDRSRRLRVFLRRLRRILTPDSPDQDVPSAN